mmetsp:Transcript_26232/g.31830  ORF Transcript_26232/g.31830 Transcript_26232/m.31830 type:complete len:168 (+) Transcript_26232:258-761(+)
MQVGKQGISKKEFYDMKFGPGKLSAFMPRLSQAFDVAGCGKLSIEGNTGPTQDGHRLMSLAIKQGKGDELMEEFMKNYFIESKAICDPDVLIAACNKVGVEQAAEFLSNPEAGAAELESELQIAKKFQVRGVPFFIISDGVNRPCTFSGAQPPEAFKEVFEEMVGEA